MKTLKDFEFKGKRVILRVDFNVPLNEKGEILDDFRIKESLPTIDYLREKGAKLILISHLGRPQKIKNLKERKRKYSLEKIAKKLEEILKSRVVFFRDYKPKKIQKELQEGKIVFLENLRFYKGEENNDLSFAKFLSQLGDIFVQDAFSVCHREHASVVGIPKFLPSCAGFLLEKEVRILSKILKKPWRPFVAIIGGAKIESKIKAALSLLEKVDTLLFGGKIAHVIAQSKGIWVGKPFFDEKIIKLTQSLKLTDPKIHLPLDVLVSPDEKGELYTRVCAPAGIRRDEEIFDIGPETIQLYGKILQKAKMILWVGPLGVFENPLFEKGTKEIGEKIVKNHLAFKMAGGGETIFALKKFDLRDKFDFISTGGGAMLEFLSKNKLLGIEALK